MSESPYAASRSGSRYTWTTRGVPPCRVMAALSGMCCSLAATSSATRYSS